MEGVMLPYLPTTLWILAGAMVVLILLVVLGYYIYWRKREAALLEDIDDVAKLSARKQFLQADSDALRKWIEDQKIELERLTAERENQERLRSELADLEQRCAAKDQANQALRNEVGELENQRHHLSRTLEKLEQEIGDLDGKRAEAQSIEGRLDELRARSKEAQETIRNLTEVQSRLDVLSNEKSSLEGMIESLRDTAAEARNETAQLKYESNQTLREAEKLNNELSGLRKEKAELKIDMDSLRQKQTSLERDIARLENKIEEYRATSASAKADADKNDKIARDIHEKLERNCQEMTRSQKEMKRLELEFGESIARKASLEQEIKRLENKIEEYRATSASAKADADKNDKIARDIHEKLERNCQEMTRSQKEMKRLELEFGELNARKASLEQEIKRLEGKIGPQTGDEIESLSAYADLLEKEPDCLSSDEFKGQMKEHDESAVLQKLKNDLYEEGLVFSSRVIDAFHTSLKCQDINPITVLAGVSGTGKTLLPMRYAETMGMHRLVMAVQPRWDSPQDLFGFYNYLEKEYKATELSRTLVRMDPYNYSDDKFSNIDCDWAKERLLLVLLDEMNLARTEYYFSEFLSKLELRRDVRDPSERHNRNQAEVELDTGPGKERFRLWVPENILFVGTMNEDETTQTLSDKVLDRANVIRFGKPNENTLLNLENNRAGANKRAYISFDRWKSWRKEIYRGADWYEKVSRWTHRLNTALDRAGRPFGYRVQQAIEKYVANYPRTDDSDRYKLAFADQVDQKIIPKMRGIDLGNGNANECLSEVEAVISELGDNEFSNSFDAARAESENLGMFQWRGVTRSQEK